MTMHHSGHVPKGDLFAGLSDSTMQHFFRDEWARRQKKRKGKKSGKKKK